MLYLSLIIFFFFKQKTAYEMRISDWSSDVCSSDLAGRFHDRVTRLQQPLLLGLLDHVPGDARLDRAGGIHELELGEHAVDLEQRSVADGVEEDRKSVV